MERAHYTPSHSHYSTHRIHPTTPLTAHTTSHSHYFTHRSLSSSNARTSERISAYLFGRNLALWNGLTTHPHTHTTPLTAYTPLLHSPHTQPPTRTTSLTAVFPPQTREHLSELVHTCLEETRPYRTGECPDLDYGPIGDWDVSR